MITDLSITKGMNNYDLREKFAQSKIAQETYKCDHKAFVTKPMGNELKNHERYPIITK